VVVLKFVAGVSVIKGFKPTGMVKESWGILFLLNLSYCYAYMSGKHLPCTVTAIKMR
jgi:hypothetical protein